MHSIRRTFTMHRLLAPVVLLLSAPRSSAKVIDGIVRLSSQETEQYMAKFSYSART